MSDAKKNRTTFLDRLADSPYPPTALSNRPMRAARDAVDTYRVWELDPDQIEDSRVSDRLNQQDVDDLRISIETSGQAVPILVRRHPSEEDKYLLVYGRRRLEAIRSSQKVDKVKALIATIDENAAVEAQISENSARRDLTFIEKALFAHELVESGFGTRAKVAEVLGVSKSWMSMSLSIVETVTPDVIRAIGSAPGVGRPRWESLANLITQSSCQTADMINVAKTKNEVMREGAMANQTYGTPDDPSVSALATVENMIKQKSLRTYNVLPPKKKAAPNKPALRPLSISGETAGSVKRTGKKVQLQIEPGEFADFVEENAEFLLGEMHKYWREKDDQK